MRHAALVQQVPGAFQILPTGDLEAEMIEPDARLVEAVVGRGAIRRGARAEGQGNGLIAEKDAGGPSVTTAKPSTSV